MKVYVLITKNITDCDDSIDCDVLTSLEVAKQRLRNCIDVQKGNFDCEDKTDDEFLDKLAEEGWEGGISEKCIDIYENGYAAHNSYAAWIVEREI